MKIKTYADALRALNSVQGPSKNPLRARADILAALPRANIPPSALNRLNVVHVAGTKGKGTTCAMVASILAHAAPHARIGLHTSPHLVAVRERIQINGEAISEGEFAASFFAVWDALAAACEREGVPFDDAASLIEGRRPRYARLLTLVAFDAFLRNNVDVAVVETGLGGENDATNVVKSPTVVGITSLGLDHMDVLGNTVQEIAWHKAGIIKPGCPAFTVEQDYPETVEVLEGRARDAGTVIETVPVDKRLEGVNIRPDALFQKKNASLAIKLAETVLPRLSSASLPTSFASSSFAPFARCLEQIRWRGRCEVKPDDAGFNWFLDCAHTHESLRVATEWFAGVAHGARCTLVFNQQTRATAMTLLDAIHTEATSRGIIFEKAYFCTPITFKSGFKEDLVNNQADPQTLSAMTVQHRFAAHWKSLSPSTIVEVVPTIQETVDRVRAEASGSVFVTGGVHVVGGFLSVLE